MQPYTVNEHGNALTVDEAKNWGLLSGAVSLTKFAVKVATIPVWVPAKLVGAIVNGKHKEEKEEELTWD